MQGNVLNWLGLVVDSAICGCKNGSSLPVGEKMAALWLGGPMRECSELAWDCRGFCNMWLQKWFLSANIAALWLGGTMQGNVLNWLGIVVDSAICGCKNGSSLTVGEKMAALWLGGSG